MQFGKWLYLPVLRERVNKIFKVASKVAFFAFVIPLLLVWTIVQLPFSLAGSAAKRRRDKRFTAAMRSVGRTVNWPDARREVDNQHGTFIDEMSFSDDGPYRLWWTPDDVPDACPYPCRYRSDPVFTKHLEMLLHGGQVEEAKRFEAAVNSEYAIFYEWCRSHYTDPGSGTALLVDTAGYDWEWMENHGRRWVSIRTY